MRNVSRAASGSGCATPFPPSPPSSRSGWRGWTTSAPTAAASTSCGASPSSTSELAVSNIAASRRGPWIYLVASRPLLARLRHRAGARRAALPSRTRSTIGTVFMFMQYAGMMAAADRELIGSQLQQFQTASASLSRIRAPALDRAGPARRTRPRLGERASRSPRKLAFERRRLRLSGRRAGAARRLDRAEARGGARPAGPHRQRQDHAHAPALPALRPSGRAGSRSTARTSAKRPSPSCAAASAW